MADLLFDKLAYKDRLTRAGVAEESARAHADALEEALRESLVTKPYLDARLTAIKADLDVRLAQLETRLTLRMGVITAAGVAVLTAIKFFG